MSYLLLALFNQGTRVRVSADHEELGLYLTEHGEVEEADLMGQVSQTEDQAFYPVKS